MGLKKDRKKTSSVVLPKKKKNKYSRRRYDFSGYDTKNKKEIKPKKIRKGPRGGKFVKVKGKKRYLRS